MAITKIINGVEYGINPTDESFFNDFIDTVRQMREKQSEYFRTRGADALHSAKLLERQVDRMLRMMDEGDDVGLFALDPSDNCEIFKSE